MEIKRFYVNKGDVQPCGTVQVTGDEFVHAIKVSRYKVGYSVILCDGSGMDYHCTITDVLKDSFLCKVDSVVSNANELKTNLVLYMCGIEKSDIAVQKATELGAAEIHLVNSQFTNAKNQNVTRLNKIALEAAKQCGRAVVPKVFAAVEFPDALTKAAAECGQVILAYECERTLRIAECIDKTAGSIALFVGSEGGYSTQEIALAKSAGAKVVTLGKRILRAETASIVMLALCADLLEK